MWKLCKIANGNYSCDNSELESKNIINVITHLQERFNIEYDNRFAASLDGVYMDARIAGEKMTIGWDCWSGVFIMPKNKSGNSVVKAVFEFLEQDK